MQKSSLSSIAFIWFGAAVSIAEIMTGTLFAPLGWGKALAAILLGHLIGGFLLYLAGLIGAHTGESAMEGVKRSFGRRGGGLFALLNVIQLVGWTAVMIAAGAQSARGVAALPEWAWSLILGALILVWITVRAREFKVVNALSAALLFVLAILLTIVVFRRGGAVPEIPAETLRFGEALELSIAMPLSWLPLIADYTSGAARSRTASAVSAGIYTTISAWMYLIGVGAALYAGGGEIALIMQRAGLGVPALLIVLFSTVTTTYLDVYSAAISLGSITRKAPPRLTGVAVCVLGTLLAIFAPANAFENFLYYIGSVFAPMIAIQIADVFLLRHQAQPEKRWNVPALACWLAGFLLYRGFLAWQPAVGSTIPVMLISGAGYVLAAKIGESRENRIFHA